MILQFLLWNYFMADDYFLPKVFFVLYIIVYFIILFVYVGAGKTEYSSKITDGPYIIFWPFLPIFRLIFYIKKRRNDKNRNISDKEIRKRKLKKILRK